MVRIGVIGYGYWGPNIARNFAKAQGCCLTMICDGSEPARRRAGVAHPSVEVTADAGAVITSANVDAVAIVTPVWTHFELAKSALMHGKHVFVEKPFTATSEQAEVLINLAEQKNLQIMVDHTFLFTGAVKKIKGLLDSGALGKLFYYDSTRVNLGLFQHDCNVIWDLAPHDLSILDYFTSETPEAVVSTGQSHVNGHENVAYITVYFTNRLIGHVNVNWLSPVKVRTTLIGGDKKMLVWNDLDPDEKVKVYDKGADLSTGADIYDLLVSYRSGDVWVPKLAQTEALSEEAQYFVECVSSGSRPFNDGASGLRVVRLLEAASRSLQNRGRAAAV